MTAVAIADRQAIEPLAEAATFPVYPDDPPTADRLLRRLEVLRKRLSVR